MMIEELVNRLDRLVDTSSNSHSLSVAEVEQEYGSVVSELVQLQEDALGQVLVDLFESKNESRQAMHEESLKRVLRVCEFVIFGGEDPERRKQDLQKMPQPGTRCHQVWLNNHVAYRCRDCGTTESSCMCVECFDPQDHVGHDFRIYKSGSGGCCDCGDPNAWKPSGYCKRHRQLEQGEDSSSAMLELDQELVNRARIVFQVLCYEVMLCIYDGFNLGKVFQQEPGLSQSRTNKVALMATPLHGVLNVSISRDYFMQKREHTSMMITDLLVSYCSICPQFRVMIGDAMTHVFDQQTSLLNSLLKFGIFFDEMAQERVGILYLRLLIDDKFKTLYTKSFVSNYGYLVDNFLYGPEPVRKGIAKFLDRILCQLCNSEEQVSHLVTGESNDMLGIILSRILDLVDQNASIPVPVVPVGGSASSHGSTSSSSSSSLDGGFPPMSRLTDNKIIDCNSYNIQQRLFERLVMDLRLLLVHDSVIFHAIRDRQDIITKTLKLLSLLQEMNLQTRRCGAHVLFETYAAWEAALILELDLAWALFRLVDGYTHVLRQESIESVFTKATEQLIQWLQGRGLVAVRFINPGCSENEYDRIYGSIVASLTHKISSPLYQTSIHIPLHRFWASLFHATLMVKEPMGSLRDFMVGSCSENVSRRQVNRVLEKLVTNPENIPLGFACFVLDHPLRVLVKMAQVVARLWVRNGAMVEVEPPQYYAKQWTASGLDLDIFIMQFGASVLEGDSFVRLLSKRFELENVFDYSRFLARPVRRSSSRRRREQEDQERVSDDQLGLLCENFLRLIGVLATDRTRLGETPEQTFRKQIIHILASGDDCKRTFSAIEGRIHNKLLEAYKMEDVLAEVADYSPPASNDSEGVYVLRDSTWLEDISIYYSHYSHKQAHTMESNFRMIHRRKRKRRQASMDAASSSSMDIDNQQNQGGNNNGSGGLPAGQNDNNEANLMLRLLQVHQRAPIFQSFAHMPSNLLWNPELHGYIFRILHACIRDNEPVLARTGILVEALNILYMALDLAKTVDVVHCYDAESTEFVENNKKNLGQAASMRRRSNSCNGNLCWTWPRETLQTAFSPPNDMRTMSASINQRIDLVNHQIRLPFDNPFLNACELVPFHNLDTETDHGSLEVQQGNKDDWAWPSANPPTSSSYKSSGSFPSSFASSPSLASPRASIGRSASIESAPTPDERPRPHEFPAPLIEVAPRARDERCVGVSMFMLLLQLEHENRWSNHVTSLVQNIMSLIVSGMAPLTNGLSVLQSEFKRTGNRGGSRGDGTTHNSNTMMMTPDDNFIFPMETASVTSSPSRSVPSVMEQSDDSGMMISSSSRLQRLSGTGNRPNSGSVTSISSEKRSKKKKKEGASNAKSTPSSRKSKRQAKIMAEFAKKQAAFLNQLEELDDEESASGTTGGHDSSFNEQSFTASPTFASGSSSSASTSATNQASSSCQEECAWCREHHPERPIGMVAYGSLGSLTKIHQAETWSGQAKFATVGGDGQDVLDRELRKLRGFKSRLVQAGSPAATGASKDEIGDTILFRGCGHFMHIDCQRRYQVSLVPGHDIIEVKEGEYRCPICRSVANIIVPCLDGLEVQRESSSFAYSNNVSSSFSSEFESNATAPDRLQRVVLVSSFLNQVVAIGNRNEHRKTFPNDMITSTQVTRMLVENVRLLCCHINAGSSVAPQARETFRLLVKVALIYYQNIVSSVSVTEIRHALSRSLNLNEGSIFGSSLSQSSSMTPPYIGFKLLDDPMVLLVELLLIEHTGTSKTNPSSTIHLTSMVVNRALNLAVAQLLFTKAIAQVQGSTMDDGHEDAGESNASVEVEERAFAWITETKPLDKVDNKQQEEQEKNEGEAMNSLETILANAISSLPNDLGVIQLPNLGKNFLEEAGSDLKGLLKHFFQGVILVLQGFGFSKLKEVGKTNADELKMDELLPQQKDHQRDDEDVRNDDCILHYLMLNMDSITHRVGDYCSQMMQVHESGSLPEVKKLLYHLCLPPFYSISPGRYPSLMEFPELFTSLYLKFCVSGEDALKCKVCNTNMSADTSMICLMCGQIICFRETCRASTGEVETHHILCKHANACTRVMAREICCFLPAYMSAAYVIVGPNRAMQYGSIYLDSHGEQDPTLRRGKPLFLSQPRVERLQKLVSGLYYLQDNKTLRRLSHASR